MTFLPIVGRELRVASRRGSTYWMRTGAALLVLLLGAWIFLIMHRAAPRQIAQALFGVMTGSAVLYCLLAGLRSTADCLSAEKRQGTLGLLFLTDLKGYDVVFGKLAATSVNALYGVLAVVPMLAIPLLMGGVAPAEFGRMALVALNTLFFSLALGLCVSAMSRSARAAMAVTFGIILLLTAVLPAIGARAAFLHYTQRVQFVFLAPSAGYNFAMAFDTPYRTWPHGFWGSLLVIHGLGWLCLVLASVIAPRAWQDKPPGAQRLRWREYWRLWSYGNVPERSAFRRRLLDQNAYFWLSARARLKPACVWAVLGLLAGVWLWGAVKFPRDWLAGPVYVTTAIILNLLLKGWFATEAGRQLVEDRQQDALELLLCTPLTVRDILRGQFLALKRQFLGPVLAVLAVFVLCLLASLAETSDADERAAFICFTVAGMVMLVADLAALYWVGMWQGLTARNPNRAAGASVARILVVPWVLLGLIAVTLPLVLAGGRQEPGWAFALALWFGVGLAVDIAFGTASRANLLLRFRRAAEQRYRPQPGFWRRLLGEHDFSSHSPA